MGDIFNASRPDSLSVDILRSALEVMEYHKLPVYVIQGQHDRSTPPWPVALGAKNLSYVHKAPFQPIDGGPVFYGIDQCPVGAELQETLNNLPSQVTGLIMHQLARQVFPLDGAWDFDSAWVPERIKHLYIGDYHVATDFEWSGGRAYYSGSTYLCSTSEQVNKSFLHLTVDNGKIVTSRIPLKTRRYFKLTVEDEQGLARVVELLKQPVPADPVASDHKPVLMLNYQVSVPKVMETVQPLIGNKYIYWPVPTSNRIEWTREGLASETEVRHISMASCIGTFLEPASEAYAFTAELLADNDTETVLTRWRARKGIA